MSDAPPSRKSGHLVQGIGLTSAITLVMGSMIGSGIFVVSADVARLTGSPGLLIGAWLVTAFMTVAGALCYGELAAMMPRAGGQYIFLRESLGPLWGFLYGWTLFLVIQTGTIAAVSVAFGKFLGVFFPAIAGDHWIIHAGRMGSMDVGLSTQNGVAILLVIGLSAVNVLGVKAGALIQNVFTAAKTLALLALIVVGIWLGRQEPALSRNFGDFWRGFSFSARFPVALGGAPGGGEGASAMVGIAAILAVAQVGTLFSADSWANVTFAAAEVRRPGRNLPLALAIGTGSVVLIYILANFAYLCVLPLQGDPNGATVVARGIQYATSERVGTAVLEQIFRQGGARLMAGAILISTFGCVNGLILAGARVFYAMSQDGLFFRAAGELHPRYGTPVPSIVIQAAWAVLLCLTGSYGQLLDYIMFAVVLFYILTIYGLFVLRRTRPELPRPYRAIGYPVLPALYLALAIWIDLVLLRYKPQFTWPGLIVVLLGVPVYFFWRPSRR